MARKRNKEYNTVHHLTSRVAHRVYFLKEEERNDFTTLMRRVADFSGIELLGWCVMTNHFHILALLPPPPALSEEEILQRLSRLKEDAHRLFADEERDRSGDRCQTLVAKTRAIRRRMYSIAEFMRMVKQWFTEDYNLRNGHKGTMWEAVYGDRVLHLPQENGGYEELRDVLAYIHLNPIRAAITNRYDGYEWSSYPAFLKGDPTAQAGMRRLYPGRPDEEIAMLHERRMTERLEDWKRKRAEEIARKREMGYDIPSDALTEECLVIQAKSHFEEVRKSLEQLHAERELSDRRKERSDIIRRQIRCELELHPDFSARDFARLLEVPERTVQRYLKQIREAPSTKR